MSARKRKHVYGPVPSRRLGRSLGVDLVPYKVCPFDCTYCQVGRTTVHTDRRDAYLDADEVLAEVREALAAGPECDYVTLSGSGEPTLHADLARIVAAIKAMTDVPLAVLTNSALLSDPAVRQALLPADLIVPSLDAGDAETFARVNRPCAGVTFEKVLDGLKALRREYAGRIRLEVLLVAGLNDSDEQVAALRAAIDAIGPDAVELNTVTRPPADDDARAVAPDDLERIRRALGPKARIVAGYTGADAVAGDVTGDDVLALVRRRPCTIDDLAAGLQCHRWEAEKVVAALHAAGKVTREDRAGRSYVLVRGA